ncbi:MAG: glycerol kinase GlpK [Selenomonadaceae bacterium]|nr:glycerol kinase GlpK [Selenomonadaceae bacterium]
MSKYVMGIDQSTQGTKILLFDSNGKVAFQAAQTHKQFINDKGWVEHNPDEIWNNIKILARQITWGNGVSPRDIVAIGISNQRETALAWNKSTGESIYPAIVWQCARGAAICDELETRGLKNLVKENTGLTLSPYFSAAKLAWIMRNVPEAQKLANEKNLCMGTVDSWLIHKMTGGEVFKTDYSNASRTQFFNIKTLAWDNEICAAFGIPVSALPEVNFSDSFFGKTTVDGIFDAEIPVWSMLGDSHAALFGQGCHTAGLAKGTYGTGSSIMLNTGENLIKTEQGLASTIAWGMNKKISYALEGNINYTGASITWLKDDLKLIESAAETENLSRLANPADKSYFVPAFTGLGAPYYDNDATGIFSGITRVTGKNEMVRAVVDSIAYQIFDVIDLMEKVSGDELKTLQADGGPTRNAYLMQFQSNILNKPVEVPPIAELSAMGAAYCAGIAAGFYDKEKVFGGLSWQQYNPNMSADEREKLLKGWHEAVKKSMSRI